MKFGIRNHQRVYFENFHPKLPFPGHGQILFRIRISQPPKFQRPLGTFSERRTHLQSATLKLQYKYYFIKSKISFSNRKKIKKSRTEQKKPDIRRKKNSSHILQINKIVNVNVVEIPTCNKMSTLCIISLNSKN